MSDTGNAEAEAMAVLDRHMAALNARDAAALAATLHFPHYRLSGGRLRVWETPATYLDDFFARAGEGWDHSAWDYRYVVAASDDKVHLDVQFTRYRADGGSLGSFRSLWVVARLDGRWAAQLRSSFAA
ncbi:MAG: hypothetical protein K2X46_19605 [Roseomonas sp.]|nr:hypothetical protein [Roseomonas sp.]MBX9699145.1 hypothetical protein [Acetobacteraceae bacterium]